MAVGCSGTSPNGAHFLLSLAGCGLPRDPASLAAFAAEQQGRSLAPSAAATPGPPVARTSGWGCLGAIWELIRGIMDIFD